MKKFVVGSAGAGARVDVFVAKQYPHFARSALSVLFDDSLVRVNGKLVRPGQKLRDGESVEVEDSILEASHPIELPVIYEDDDVIVIDKPAGVLTHSKGSLNTEGTVASFIAGKLSSDLSGNRAGIVHRLDRATSGVIIAAKSQPAMKYLQKQFSSRKVAKTYLALVEGVVRPLEATIDAPVDRNPRNPKTFMAGPTGKPAQTAYKVLKTLSGNSLLELKPKTGRTHQLRVHLAYIGHPIVGDSLYGRNGRRMLLHASQLTLRLPSGEAETFSSRPPAEFGDV